MYVFRGLNHVWIKDVANILITWVTTLVVLASFVVVASYAAHLVFEGTVGLYMYGSPTGQNYGIGFWGIGGLELNGPQGTGFFACQGQC